MEVVCKHMGSQFQTGRGKGKKGRRHAGVELLARKIANEAYLVKSVVEGSGACDEVLGAKPSGVGKVGGGHLCKGEAVLKG